MDVIQFLTDNIWITYLVLVFVAFKVGWSMHEVYFISILHRHPERFEMAIKLAKAVQTDDPTKQRELLKDIKELHEELHIEIMQELMEQTPEEAIQLDLEEVNGQVFAYNKSTGEFLAQGPNKDMAAMAASARFPDKKFWHPDFKQDSQTA
jgi:hypothetical protein